MKKKMEQTKKEKEHTCKAQAFKLKSSISSYLLSNPRILEISIRESDEAINSYPYLSSNPRQNNERPNICIPHT